MCMGVIKNNNVYIVLWCVEFMYVYTTRANISPFSSWIDTFSLMSSGDAFEDNGTWILSILIPKQVVLEFDVDIDVQIDLGPGTHAFCSITIPAWFR